MKDAKTFGNVTWEWQDIVELRSDWSQEQCETFLEEIDSQLIDDQVATGWATIECFLEEQADLVDENILTVQEFAELVETQAISCNPYSYAGSEENLKVKVIPGKKYTKIDQGLSGKFMIDDYSNIFGIKSYGRINKNQHFGTLATTHLYFWGGYVPRLRK